VSGSTVTARALGRELQLRLPDERRPDVGQEGLALVRSEHVLLSPGEAVPSAGWYAFGTVRSRAFLGAYERFWLEIPGAPTPLLADVPSLVADESADQSAGAGMGAAIQPGDTVTATLRPGASSWLW